MNWEKIYDEDYCYVIGEIGLNHNGSMAIAEQLIDSCVTAGCDAVKFQKRDVKNLAIKSVLDAQDERFPEFGSTYREIREFLEFNKDDLNALKQYAESQGIDFFVTAFDLVSLDDIYELGLRSVKIASHGLTNLELLHAAVEKQMNVILSTGMAAQEDIQNAYDVFSNSPSKCAFLHCISSYPTPLSDCNLRMMDTLNVSVQGYPVGYSGHEKGFDATLAAVARGAKIVERHVTLENDMAGFDHKLSLNPKDLTEMVEKIRKIQLMLGSADRRVLEAEQVTAAKYHVSAVSSFDLTAGQVLDRDMICFKNPGTGIPPKQIQKFIGRRLATNIAADTLLTDEMFV